MGYYRDVCMKKKKNTEAEARKLAAEHPGWEAIPCPFSDPDLGQHWHTGRSGPKQRSRKWFLSVDREARERGGMGYPPGYIDGALNRARNRAKEVSA